MSLKMVVRSVGSSGAVETQGNGSRSTLAVFNPQPVYRKEPALW